MILNQHIYLLPMFQIVIVQSHCLVLFKGTCVMQYKIHSANTAVKCVVAYRSFTYLERVPNSEDFFVMPRTEV